MPNPASSAEDPRNTSETAKNLGKHDGVQSRPVKADRARACHERPFSESGCPRISSKRGIRQRIVDDAEPMVGAVPVLNFLAAAPPSRSSQGKKSPTFGPVRATTGFGLVENRNVVVTQQIELQTLYNILGVRSRSLLCGRARAALGACQRPFQPTRVKSRQL